MSNRAALIIAILNTLKDSDGAGSDLHLMGEYDVKSGYVYIEGNLDVSQLAGDVLRAAQDTPRYSAALAAAWQAGRESIATDMMKPLPDNGHRVASVNPYL